METNRKILIVDDQKDLREQLAKLLRKSGKKDEASSMVQMMRKKLMGQNVSEDDGDAVSDPTYQVDTAGQGEEGYEMVKKAAEVGDPYAIVFLDMRMPPGWDGLETARKIREVDKSIEIVIMTAYADHDQLTISEVVGMPEKLLYIKKPFQTEEIFQLALSLTSKWTLERREGNKRKWLENLARCMSRIQYTSVFDADDFFKAVLSSLCGFLECEKGFIVRKMEDREDDWRLIACAGVEQHDAETFIRENADRLKNTMTTQKVQEKVFLPLKKDSFFAVCVVSEARPQSDPEWFKFLSLLLMTASNAMRATLTMDQDIKEKVNKTAGAFREKTREALSRAKAKGAAIQSQHNVPGLSELLTEIDGVLASFKD